MKLRGWQKFRRKQVPLTGAPAVRRPKTYSAEPGYVYVYWFSGMRPAEREGVSGAEYVFEVTSGREPQWQVSVFLGSAVLADWMNRHGRELSASERYGLAKMSLLRAFDERESPEAMRDQVIPAREEIEQISATLDL